MSSQPNQGLADGLAVLSGLCAAGAAVGGRELARRLGLHHAKVNRLLMTLAGLGLVRQDERRSYLPAAGVHVLAALAGHGSGLLRRARPVLADLHDRWPDLTLAIGVLWQDRVAYLYHAGPGARAVDALRLPDLLPATDSSIGQVLADPSADHAAQVHGRHRSLAVPIVEYGQPVAGLAATGLPLNRPLPPVVRHLQRAAAAICHAEESP